MFIVYHVICDILERDGRLAEAVECFQQMRSELPEDVSVCDERAEWELGGWLQPQTCIILGALTSSIRLQSTLYEDIRAERRCRHGLYVMRRCCCPLLYSTEPRTSIVSPVDQAKQSTSWDGIMGGFVAGCQRGTCNLIIYMGTDDQSEPRRSN